MALNSLKSTLFGLGVEVKFVSPGRRANLLGVDRLRRGDTFMCSYPRSGNTWTRMIIACLLEPTLDTVDLDVIDRLVPDAGSGSPPTSPRIFKEHAPKFDLFPRVIYNVRDGRDCILSAYKYARRSLGYVGERKRFLVDRRAQMYGFWHEHVGAALAYRAAYPDRILTLRYEDMRAAPSREVERLAAFLGKRISRSQIDRILALTNLNQLKNARDYDDPRKRHTLQDGRVGNWRSELEDDELKIFEGMSSNALSAFGYDLSTIEAGGGLSAAVTESRPAAGLSTSTTEGVER